MIENKINPKKGRTAEEQLLGLGKALGRIEEKTKRRTRYYKVYASMLKTCVLIPTIAVSVYVRLFNISIRFLNFSINFYTYTRDND